MQFQSPNKAENIKISEAAAFLGQLTALGFRMGPIHLNENVSSGVAASFVPLEDVVEQIDKDDKYAVVSFACGDWHNVARLKQMWGQGTLDDFREVYTDIYRGQDANSALLNIPGAAKAIQKLIDKAGA